MQPIKAEFDGKERSFVIKRKNMPILEAGLGRSAYATFKDFGNGNWQFLDVANVLSFALHGPGTMAEQALDSALHGAKYGLPIRIPSYSPHPDVLKVITRDGHGNYAELAAEILSAAIFGAASEAVADDAA